MLLIRKKQKSNYKMFSSWDGPFKVKFADFLMITKVFGMIGLAPLGYHYSTLG